MRGLALLVALLGGCELAVSTNGLEGGCPRLSGPALVQVTTSDGSYCVDSTEVTNAQYQQFVAAGFTPPSPPAGCDPSTDPTPLGDWPPPPGYDQYPVVQVTWCQAQFFCAWAGKRLCGRIGGGPLAEVNGNVDTSVSQWVYVCSDGGTLQYPYGNTFDPNACGGQAVQSQIAEVGSHSGCVGGLPGITDMSGNVWEWSDTCASDDAGAFCHVLGGAFDSTQQELACTSERNWTRTSGAANIGFRCCLDL